MEQQRLTFNRSISSEVIIGSNILKEIVSRILRLRFGKRCIVLTNKTVADKYLQPLISELNNKRIETCTITIQDGEQQKNLNTVSDIISQLAEQKIERNNPLISLGGGVTGDIGGFCASIYKRGIPHIFLPTTLLAMVDASIGGKTGLNTDNAKNIIGTFYQPHLVAIDIAYLKTLPLSQMSYGIVEAIKHGAISDSAYYKFILKNVQAIKSKQTSLLQRLVRRSVHIKKSIVVNDELDKGDRAILNFGHTFGHAYEVLGNYLRLYHGEAVGLGMLTALKASKKLNILTDDYTESLKALLEEFNLPTSLPQEFEKEKILSVIANDKKINKDEINLILPVRLGQVQQYKIKLKELENVFSAP